MRGICGPGRRHVCTVPGLDGVPRAMRGPEDALNICCSTSPQNPEVIAYGLGPERPSFHNSQRNFCGALGSAVSGLESTMNYETTGHQLHTTKRAILSIRKLLPHNPYPYSLRSRSFDCTNLVGSDLRSKTHKSVITHIPCCEKPIPWGVQIWVIWGMGYEGFDCIWQQAPSKLTTGVSRRADSKSRRAYWTVEVIL